MILSRAPKSRAPKRSYKIKHYFNTKEFLKLEQETKSLDFSKEDLEKFKKMEQELDNIDFSKEDLKRFKEMEQELDNIDFEIKDL